MTVLRLPRIPRAWGVVALTISAIWLARLMTHTDWAAANVTLAALLFAWIVVDALCLSTIAKAEQQKPGVLAMLGAGAMGAVIVIIGAAPAVRERIHTMPALLAALGLTLALWVVLACWRVATAKRSGVTWDDALTEVAPGPFVRFFLIELRKMHLALFVWRRAPDVPEGARGFAYHRYLTPMLATLIALQVIELGVVHLLLMLWNPVVAWFAFTLTLAGLLWFIALTKSLRLMPVLVAKDYVRVRVGAPVDFRLPMHAIAAVGETFDAETLKCKATFDGTILSSPNMTLRLNRAVPMPRLFGGDRMVDRIALRLDDPAAFRAAIDEAMRR